MEPHLALRFFCFFLNQMTNRGATIAEMDEGARKFEMEQAEGPEGKRPRVGSKGTAASMGMGSSSRQTPYIEPNMVTELGPCFNLTPWDTEPSMPDGKGAMGKGKGQ